MVGDRYCTECGMDLGRCYTPPIECDACEVAGRYEVQLQEVRSQIHAQRRAAFDAGYRMGYGNGYTDRAEREDFRDDPAGCFEVAEGLDENPFGGAGDDLTSPQPAPTPTDGPDLWRMLIDHMHRHMGAVDPADRPPLTWLLDVMERRRSFGASKYGTALQTGNGRDFAVDALQEALDGMVYAYGAAMEDPEREREWMEVVWLFGAACLELQRLRKAGR